MKRNKKKKVDFEKGLKKEKEEIEEILLKAKKPLTTKQIIEKRGIKIPPRTILGSRRRKLRNPEYIRIVSKYFQTYIYDISDNKKRTLCNEGRIFRLSEKDFFEYKKLNIKFSAKQFIGYWGDWGKQVHSYYFAIPKTYFIKTRIFDDIIRNIFLKSKELSKYIDNKEEIEQLLGEAEKFIKWIEITPSIKKESITNNLYPSTNFTQYIIDYICKDKDVTGALFVLVDYGLAPILEKIEELLSFGNPDYSYVNTYRILRKELYERGIFKLPEKCTREEFYDKDFKEKIEGMIYSKLLEQQIKKHNSKI